MRLGLSLSLSNYVRGSSGPAAGPTAVPTNIYMGVPTDTSIDVTHRLANDTTGARLVVSTASNLSSPIYSAAADSATNTVSHSISGLTANTTYYVGLETAGAITPYDSGNTNLYSAGTSYTGTFKTAAAAANTAQNFRWGFGSCQSGTTAGAVLTGIRNNAPVDFFVHLGDLHYLWALPTYPTTDMTVLDAASDGVFQAQHSGKFFKNTPLAYLADDHDGLGNNATEVSHTPSGPVYPLPTGMAAAFVSYFRRRTPKKNLPVVTSTGDLSWSFVRGRVRFIMLDSRTRKRWDIATGSATLTSTVTAATTISITMPTTGGAADQPPHPGMELWINGSPTHSKILTVSPSAVNGDDGNATGVLSPFTCTLDTAVTGTAGQSVRATTQMFGPTQMTWILSELDAAAAANQFVILCFPNGWEHTGWQDDFIYQDDVGDDSGTGQRSMVGEHRAISDKIISAGLNGKVIVIGGDKHCTQIDAGSNMDFSTGGGLIMPSVRVCPLEANNRAIGTSNDWDTYDEGFATASGSPLKTSAGCYVDVTDSGGASIQIAFHPMMSSDNSTASDYTAIPSAAVTFTLPLSQPQPMSSAGVNTVQFARAHAPSATTGGWSATFLNPVTAGNLLIASFISNSSSMGPGFSAAGWTQVGSNSGSASVFEKTFWKIAGSSEPQTQSFGNTPTSAILGMIVTEISSATGWAANPIDATAVDPGSSTLRGSTSVSLTTTAVNRPVLALFAQDGSAMHSDKAGFGWQGGLTQLIKMPLPERPQFMLGSTVQAASGAATYGYTTPDTTPNAGITAMVAYSAKMMFRAIALKPA